MTSLFFVVPAHGRIEKTAICLKQLARTCRVLTLQGLDASAVVVADDENLETANSLGFRGLNRANAPLGRKWNDGYEHAARQGADYVVPIGSDDWVDPALFAELPGPTELRCHRLSSVVREDGLMISPLNIRYEGGDGVRIIPRNLLERLDYRPAEDHRDRAIDTSIMRKLQYLHSGSLPPIRYFDIDPWQIVDWKSSGGQLNTYTACVAFRYEQEQDTWETLKGRYPADGLAEMRALYEPARAVV